MNVPEQVTRLIETFYRNIEAYKHHDYNETQLRHEFLDPFFMALGWDVNNTEGLAEAYKDVIHEDSIRIGSATKAPDYCFRIGGTRKFFVEAKKPSISIKDAPHPAFQLRRYAWSAKLPLSILTDFEEFAVYDCRVRPIKADRSSAARIKYIKYTEYTDRWEEIASVFSKDAILKGSFDKYAKSARRKKGTAEVDTAFLNEIETWRDIIARNIAVRNPSLTNRQLNFAVQRTIDRIIFLRIAEDRGIERYSELLATTSGPDTYLRLFKLFEKADDRYNSGIFHFHKEPDRDEPDDLTPTLTIDDKPLKDIIKSLYYPDSPYEFAVLPAEILGQIYEQFLGKVITLTKGHHARIEYKPEVKKAGGVYYTPSYIVDYIVKNTVGNLLENKTPIATAKLKILDPACGSGSFLIAAYQFLLDWHLKYYTENNPSKYTKGRNPRLYQTDKDEYRLTISERKRILLNNIFGVDIDSQAVEVTKLSLLLKVLEGQAQLVLFHKERALPDLGNNIKCGNSLIAPDFYEGKQLAMFDEEERYRINVFDWKKEFPQIFKRKNPGFDAVIGNPPWGAAFDTDVRSYLVSRFPLVPTKTKDSYFYFLSQSLYLSRESALLGFIIPNTWLLINYAKSYRQQMLSFRIREIIDHGDGVFKNAVVESSTLLLANSKDSAAPCRAVRFRKGNKIIDHTLDKSIWLQDDYSRINLDIDQPKFYLLKKLRSKTSPFGTSCTIIWGIKPYQVGHGKPAQTKEMVNSRIYHSAISKGKLWKPLLVGSNVNRYHIHFPGNQFIKYGEWLMYQSDESKMLNPKILLRQTSDVIRAFFDENKYYCQNSVFIIHSETIHLKLLLGLLNSRLISFVYKLINPQTRKIFAEIKPSAIRQLPIYTPNLDDLKDKARHDRMVSLVQTMLDLNKQLAKSKTSHEKTALKRQIDTTDRQIDNLVYELYNLTKQEIAIIEESTQ